MIKIKEFLGSSYAKCLYFAFCLNGISALLASVGRNNNGDGDPATVTVIIGLVVFYLLSPVIVFIYGIMRQMKYKTDHRPILSGIIIALTATFIFPLFLWLGLSGIQPISIHELLPISMEEYIPIKQFIAFLLGSLSVKLIQSIVQNRKRK